MPTPDGSSQRPDSRPPLAPWRAQVSLLLGLGGMIVYAFALHLAVVGPKFGIVPYVMDANSFARAPNFAAMLASFGCAAFVAAILLAFQIRLRGLLVLVSTMGVLIGIVVFHS